MKPLLYLLAALFLSGCATSAPRDRLLARATVAGYVTQEDSAAPPILHLPDGRTIIVQGPDAHFEPNEEVVLQGQIRMTNGAANLAHYRREYLKKQAANPGADLPQIPGVSGMYLKDTQYFYIEKIVARSPSLRARR